jgi:UDP-N-acetylmuramate dehydrogenase
MSRLEVQHNVDLSTLSTFRLPARALELVSLTTLDQLAELGSSELPLLVLGGGSNTVFLEDWPGRVMLNRLGGIEVEPLDQQECLVHVGAGENWHELVRWCLNQGLYGLENLILIPGSVGAAPMQNIGAYGVELADVLESVSAWDFQRRQQVTITAADCHLSYRDSRFKSADHGRFLITGITMRLSRRFEPRTGYQSLARALTEHGINTPDPRQLAAAVMRLRRHRLPDPARLPNAGSFFGNPVVDVEQADLLLKDFSHLPHWPMPDGRIKLAAGWLIDRLGFRGRRIGDAGVYQHHALVLVNHGKASAEQLRCLIEEIHDAVSTEFGVGLESEPQLIGTTRG